MSVLRGCYRQLAATSHYSSAVVPPSSYVDFFYDKVKPFHDKIAFIDPALKQNVTFGDLRQQSNAVASGLTKCGFKKGDVLSTVGSNCLELCSILHGTMATGGVLQALRPTMQFEESVHHIRIARPRFIIATTNVVDFISKVVKEADTGVEEIFVIGGSVHGCRRIEELIEDNGSASPWGKVQIDPLTDEALILQTSGTTGMSKNVVRTHEMLKYDNVSTERAIRATMTENELVLCAGPFSHTMTVATIYGGCLSTGIGVVLANRMDLNYFMDLIDEYKITRIHLPPLLLEIFANASKSYKEKLQSLTYAGIGGSLLSEQKEEYFQQILRQNLPNLRCYQGYGTTEAGFVSICPPCPQTESKRGSIGAPAANVQMKVVHLDDPGKTCPANERGEILIFSNVIMKGYLKDELATQKVMVDGWYKSGDYGYYDDDGYFYILDRISDLIHHKDGIIIPSELEMVVTEHPDVYDCAVVGVDHADVGAVPKAFVASAKGISEDDLQAFVKKRVKYHERLVGGISFIERIPKSPAGKILKGQLVHS